MKHTRRRRPLRPFCPRQTRSQVRQQIGRVRGAMQLFQVEWLLETQQEQSDSARLRFLHDAIDALRDELSELEQL